MITSHALFNLNTVDASWRDCIQQALTRIDPAYLDKLSENPNWLPGPKSIFSAFSLPVDQTQFVLFGESPYPRATSANGYAFWDAAVNQIWSETGLSKQVNRATSLRNIIKMLLIAEHALEPNHTTQEEIANLDKSSFVQTNQELFGNFLQHGFLLLNATPVLQIGQVQKDALAWQPFTQAIIEFLTLKNPDIQLILFGNIANTIDKWTSHLPIKKIYAEHPYNISFIQNPKVINFFQPFHLLLKNRQLL